MHDTKERLSLLWIFALLNYLSVCRRDCPVRHCWLADSIRASPTMGPGGFSGLDGNTHRHDCGVSTASVESEPDGEYHRGRHLDPCERFPDLRSASGRMGQAARFS